MIGYFLTLDLLGFGAIIRNSDSAQRGRRIERWLALVDNAAATESFIGLQLISDTVFVAAPDDEKGLRSLVAFARHLLNDGVRQSLPVRGAIVRGEFEWGRLTFGQAIVEAHRLERSQNWIGVCCDAGLPHLGGLWGPESLVVYAVPFKTGAIRLQPAVAWHVPYAVELLSLLGKEGLAKEGEIVPWEVGEKANNTVQFGTYLRLRARNGESWDKFAGVLPMDVIQRAALTNQPEA